jgi:anti-sigma B factor antagonist
VTSFSSVVIQAPGAVRLVLRGDLDAASVSTADSTFRDVLGRGMDRVIIDLRELDFIDSTGVKFLIDARDAAGPLGIEIALAYGEGVVERVLTVSGVGELFEREGGDATTG